MGSGGRAVAIGVYVTGGLLLTGCVTAIDLGRERAPPTVESRPIRDSAPVSPPPGLAHLPDPEVRADPRSRYGNSPYEVFGTRYEVLESAVGYDQVGLASWYGKRFHGRPTSSGEIYNMFALTAAHKTLPIPSYARVTNRENGLTTIVRINDRGPFRPNRIIDLSYATAVKLGFEDVGTASVRVESVLPGDVEPPGGLEPRYFVLAGPFRNRDRADAARMELAMVGTDQAMIVRVEDSFGVRIGPLSTRWDAERLQALLLFRDQAASGDSDHPDWHAIDADRARDQRPAP